MRGRKNCILVVDDEPQIQKLHKIFLEDAGYKVEACEQGKAAIRLCYTMKVDLVLLDLGLPDLDGKEVIFAIRERSHVPIIICSVRDTDDEIIKCLNNGANDYITKPFNPDVLLARVKACLRKTVIEEAKEVELVNGQIRMDLMRHRVFYDDKPLSLTPKEYELLRYFMINRGKMLTHKQILKEIWGPAHLDNTQYLRVYIKQLRNKIEPDSFEPSYLVTEQGIGYRMSEKA
jgi:two-component system KDP operon response regulator KdpE